MVVIAVVFFLVVVSLMIFLVGDRSRGDFVVIEVAVTARVADVQPGNMIAESKGSPIAFIDRLCFSSDLELKCLKVFACN